MASGLQKLKHHVLLLKNKHEKITRELARESNELAPDEGKVAQYKDAQTRIEEQIKLLEGRIDNAVKIKP
jgi:transcription elongation GreA/GreB family factor